MSARIAAAHLLAEIERGHALDEALQSTASFEALEGRERGFARAIVMATLRRLGGIDAVLAHFMDRALPDTAYVARNLLRSGAAQILVLETPPHAAVGETVTAANALREARGFAKLMNAVLRKVAAEGPALFAAQAPGADLPAWLYTRWRTVYGADTAAAIANALHAEPPLDLSVKHDAADWAARIGAELLPTGSLRLSGGAVESLPGFREGEWWVQDAAAALPIKLLGDVRGKSVADLCAAPGGKTLQLAAAGARVTAVDRSKQRVEILRENLGRTKLEANVVAADVLKLKAREAFDAVLLDAPCSATGTLRRHPDVAWLRKPDDIRKLSALQRELIAAASAFVKPGGTLVYAVCSLEPEEGEGAIEAALETGAWSRAPLKPGEIPGADDFITPEGALRTLPSHWPETGGLDGFYAARLVRH
ncbi:16S rRNA m(5)C 967 methyltransferase [alpha proteobacterium U9-1i]|nr:16S rRNA m(5)C 967 methyltransferase [alpha proteobacterium U9-1i]